MLRSPNRIVACVIGPFVVGLGVVGLVSGPPILNMVHVLTGAALLLTGLSGTNYAKTSNPWIGALFLLLGLAGLFLVDSAANVLALTLTDNVLHFAAAVALLAVGLGAETPRRYA